MTLPPHVGHSIYEKVIAVMITKSERPDRCRGRYPDEFRRDTAALVLDEHRTIAEVARELGVVEQTLANRLGQEHAECGERKGFTSAEQD